MAKADSVVVGRQSFLSKVKRARVVEVGSTKYAEYEVACQWKMVVGIDKERNLQWSVWKRFSEFESLNASLKKTLGWQTDGIAFPPGYSMTLNKYTPEFIEKRKEELNIYWQGIIAIGKVTEFDKHHCSAEIKAFLDVDNAAANSDALTQVIILFLFNLFGFICLLDFVCGSFV